MKGAGCHRNHIVQAGRNLTLSQVKRCLATTPGDDGAITLRGQAVGLIGGNRNHIAQATRH